jgi:hypothetical protein
MGATGFFNWSCKMEQLPGPPTDLNKLEREKLECEIAKIKAETKVAKRSPWFAPTTFFAAALALAAVGGFCIQFSLVNTELKRLQLDKQQINIELTEARNDKNHLEQDAQTFRKELKDGKDELAKVKEELAESRARFNGNIARFGKVVPRGQEIKIEGTVLDSEGKPFADSRVFISRTGDKVNPPALHSLITDKDGSFSIAMPSGPSFTILVMAPGFGMRSTGMINVAGDSDQKLRIVVPSDSQQ